MTQPEPKTDGALLVEFESTGGQAAFAELVRRHAPMVYGVSVRVLGDHHEAQDVTQATFVALARKGRSLRHYDSIGGWLHTVAWRLAQDVRTARQRRQRREEHAVAEMATTEPPPAPVDVQGFRSVLDASIEQLPERYRQPLVLFHLQSKSIEETGRLLGLNSNTLRTRLGRARELLRKKLVRRGVTIGSVGALTALLSAESGAAVLPATFVASTVGAATGGAVSTTVAALTKGALHMLFIAKIKTVSLAAAACLIVAGTGVVAAKQMAAPSSTPSTVLAQTDPSQQPASAGTETKPPAVQPKVEPGVFTVRVTRDGMMQTAPYTLIIPVKITAVEQTPNGATDVPKVGERIGIYVPHSVENEKLLPGNCRVNLVRQRIAFKDNPKLDHWQYRFPNDFPATSIGDCQEVKKP